MRQKHLVKGVLNTLGVVSQILIHWLFLVLFSIQYVGHFLTGLLLRLPGEGLFKHVVVCICGLLDDFLQRYRQVTLRVHVVLYDHFSHLNVVGDPE